jgi:hypothetical protein
VKEELKKSVRFFFSEMLDVKNSYESLSIAEKAEFGKIISFGLFVNGAYGLLHGNIFDFPVVFVSVYAIMKAIKLEKESR